MDSLLGLIGPAIFVAFVAIWFFTAAVKVVQEYERGVVFRLGRLVGARGPGLILLIPKIERMAKVDLRVITLDVPAQEAITRDNVTVKVNAVAYFRVVDPSRAVVTVLDYRRATSLIAQTTLRSVLGQFELDSLLTERDRVNQELQRIIDEQTEAWGIKVTSVEVRDVELPDTMKRAMARQAEAEREKRAKIIHAEGEFAAAERLAEAAGIITSESAGLQLRYLQTLSQIANDRRSTIVFPLPIDLTRGLTGLDGLMDGAGHDDGNGHGGGRSGPEGSETGGRPGSSHRSGPGETGHDGDTARSTAAGHGDAGDSRSGQAGGPERSSGPSDAARGSGHAPSGAGGPGDADTAHDSDVTWRSDDDTPTRAFRPPLPRPDEEGRGVTGPFAVESEGARHAPVAFDVRPSRRRLGPAVVVGPSRRP